jgi:hypothetical protein
LGIYQVLILETQMQTRLKCSWFLFLKFSTLL